MKPTPAFFDLDSDKKWLAEFERKLDQVEKRAKQNSTIVQNSDKQIDKKKKVAQ